MDAVRLVASMMVGTGEGCRYLGTALRLLDKFCDTIVVLDESTDEATELVLRSHQVDHHRAEPGSFFRHEGRARQRLFDLTLRQQPSHILAIDADEFVSDGHALRSYCERDEGNGAWTLDMAEVWKADDRALWTRRDGGWREHPVPILYRVPRPLGERWHIQDRQLACGREPMAVRYLAPRGVATGVTVYHFGWANQAERQARYDRYAAADGGRFHASKHLQSILYPDRQVRLARKSWPVALADEKDTLVERVHRQA